MCINMCIKSHCRGARIVQSGHARDRGPKRREKSQKTKFLLQAASSLWSNGGGRKLSILNFAVSLKLLHSLDSLLYIVPKHWLHNFQRKSNPVWSIWQNLEMMIIDMRIIAIVIALSPLALARAQFSLSEQQQQQQPDTSNPYLTNDPNLLAIIPDTRPQPAPLVNQQQVNRTHLSTSIFFFLKSVRLSL